MKEKLSTIFAFICLAVLIVCMSFCDVGGVSSSTLYGSVVRLHVLADSDSVQDRQIKYKVRDGLLSVTEKLFSDCASANEAVKTAQKNEKLLLNTARKVLEEEGCNKKVEVVIGKENYPEKKYGSLTFPEGEYLSVRVIIGSGRGQNWWCVLFPPLCNAGVEDGSRILQSYGIDEKQVELLENESKKGSVEIFGCRIRLKILDYFL